MGVQRRLHYIGVRRGLIWRRGRERSVQPRDRRPVRYNEPRGHPNSHRNASEKVSSSILVPRTKGTVQLLTGTWNAARYEKYQPLQTKEVEQKDGEQFMNMYREIEADLETLRTKSDEAKLENNRAVVASLNAEVRRAKADLLNNKIPKLAKLVRKGKGLDKSTVQEREDMVETLVQSIRKVSDGLGTLTIGPTRNSTKKKGKASKVINLQMADVEDAPSYNMDHTDDSLKFEEEWKKARSKQDGHLEDISGSLKTLKSIGGDIGEEIQRQETVIDEMETKIDGATAQIANNNEKLRGLVTSMRSTRNFCVDVTLICIVLGIVGYIYNQAS